MLLLSLNMVCTGFSNSSRKLLTDIYLGIRYLIGSKRGFTNKGCCPRYGVFKGSLFQPVGGLGFKSLVVTACSNMS